MSIYKEFFKEFCKVAKDYHNAKAGIGAKQAELDALTLDVKLVEILLQEGETSKLEYEKKKVLLAKAQYELEQKYVEQNVAYWKLTMLCE